MPTCLGAMGRKIVRRSDVVGIVINDAAAIRLLVTPVPEARGKWAAT